MMKYTLETKCYAASYPVVFNIEGNSAEISVAMVGMEDWPATKCTIESAREIYLELKHGKCASLRSPYVLDCVIGRMVRERECKKPEYEHVMLQAHCLLHKGTFPRLYTAEITSESLNKIKDRYLPITDELGWSPEEALTRLNRRLQFCNVTIEYVGEIEAVFMHDGR